MRSLLASLLQFLLQVVFGYVTLVETLGQLPSPHAGLMPITTGNRGASMRLI